MASRVAGLTLTNQLSLLLDAGYLEEIVRRHFETIDRDREHRGIGIGERQAHDQPELVVRRVWVSPTGRRPYDRP